MPKQSEVTAIAYKKELGSERAQTTACTVHFTVDALTIIIGELLLALRHPENKGPSSKFVMDWIPGMIAMILKNGFPVIAKQLSDDFQQTKLMRGEV